MKYIKYYESWNRGYDVTKIKSEFENLNKIFKPIGLSFKCVSSGQIIPFKCNITLDPLNSEILGPFIQIIYSSKFKFKTNDILKFNIMENSDVKNKISINISQNNYIESTLNDFIKIIGKYPDISITCNSQPSILTDYDGTSSPITFREINDDVLIQDILAVCVEHYLAYNRLNEDDIYKIIINKIGYLSDRFKIYNILKKSGKFDKLLNYIKDVDSAADMGEMGF